jgi:hypothetical protein
MITIVLDTDLFVKVLFAYYAITSLINILVGVQKGKKGERTHYGWPEILWGVIFLFALLLVLVY